MTDAKPFDDGRPVNVPGPDPDERVNLAKKFPGLFALHGRHELRIVGPLKVGEHEQVRAILRLAGFHPIGQPKAYGYTHFHNRWSKAK